VRRNLRAREYQKWGGGTSSLVNREARRLRRLDLLLGDRMQVEHRPARGEKLVDVAQGVHDALTLDSSKRLGEERQVELGPRGVDLCRADGSRRDALGNGEGQSGASPCDELRIGIDGEDGGGGGRVAEGQPAVAAAQLEHARTIHRRQLRECASLRFRVDPPSRRRIIAA
jgi:hypothetical protein